MAVYCIFCSGASARGARSARAPTMVSGNIGGRTLRMTSKEKGRTGAEKRTARQALIAQTVIRNGRATIDELQKTTGVSTMTVYRDIATLEQRGILQRHRGLVVAIASGVHEADAEYRLERSNVPKLAVAKAAAELVRPATSVMVDDSTSAVWLLREMEGLDAITIVTNSLLVAKEVTGERRAAKLIVVGGDYQAWAQALTGPVALAQIRTMSVGQCILSASGIDGLGCYHPDAEVAAVKQAMIAQAEESILLLEHEKFQRRALYQFATLTDFAHVVVDGGISDALRTQLLDAGVPLTVVDVGD